MNLIRLFSILAFCLLAAAGSAQNLAKSDMKSIAPAGVKVVHFNLAGHLSEGAVSDPFQLFGGEIKSLKSLIDRMDKARVDDRVKGVVISWNQLDIGIAQSEEIRGALLRLKKADKPVLVHLGGEGPMLTIVPYSMLTAATSISVEPRSDIWLTGIAGEQLYLKDLLGKLGLHADYLHMGDYKSAAEMVTNTSPSLAADKMMNWLFDGLYGALVEQIAEGRNLTPQHVRELVDNGPYLAEDALKADLVDKVEFKDEFLEGLKKQFGEGVDIDNRYEVKEGPKTDLSNFAGLLQLFSPKATQDTNREKNVIAVVYVDGMILPGHNEPSPLGGGTIAYGADIAYWLAQAAKDSSVKAVVLRVDSPGGSALGSEQIWRATQQVKEKKPIVVSMGNVAGSGGYYCSCGANAIYADRNTLTASIGVVGGKFVTEEMWDKLGVNWVPYHRGANSLMFESSQPFTPDQRAKFEDWMHNIYDRFQDHVKQGRGDKLKKPMDELNGGRVFTGSQAKDNGLIDEIGGLSDAVGHAAKLAGIAVYDTRVFPRPKDFITAFMEELSGTGERTSDLNVAMHPAAATAAPSWHSPTAADPIIAILSTLDPKRAAAFQRALLGITLLRREGVAMLPPFELVIE